VGDHRHKGGEEFELRLVAQPDDVPAAARVRQLLKQALRGFRLRCISVRDVTPDPGATTTAPPTPGAAAEK
jgi:hypothetical protein